MLNFIFKVTSSIQQKRILFIKHLITIIIKHVFLQRIHIYFKIFSFPPLEIKICFLNEKVLISSTHSIRIQNNHIKIGVSFKICTFFVDLHFIHLFSFFLCHLHGRNQSINILYDSRGQQGPFNTSVHYQNQQIYINK